MVNKTKIEKLKNFLRLSGLKVTCKKKTCCKKVCDNGNIMHPYFELQNELKKS